MKAFGIVLILAISGLCIAYDILTSADDSGATTIIDSFTHVYRISFADYDTENYDRAIFVLFYFASILLPLIMLNMLIAIMSDTYEKIIDA